MRRRIEPIAVRWRRLRGGIGRALRQVAGCPDYGAYLDHCRRVGHVPRLTEREFVTEHFERRGKAPRCC